VHLCPDSSALSVSVAPTPSPSASISRIAKLISVETRPQGRVPSPVPSLGSPASLSGTTTGPPSPTAAPALEVVAPADFAFAHGTLRSPGGHTAQLVLTGVRLPHPREDVNGMTADEIATDHRVAAVQSSAAETSSGGGFAVARLGRSWCAVSRGACHDRSRSCPLSGCFRRLLLLVLPGRIVPSVR